ncbi:MAG: hypothetical protein KDJ35_02620 [Alphaproteobacteria bacterium]|nr:hypothetical protein [Alphaproteobacteria bacterium]
MASKKKYSHFTHSDMEPVPFDSAEEVWFWFIRAQQARNDGARFTAGQGAVNRPCEPLDILKILDRLYRNRRLLRDHLLVLRHYGRRDMAPDPRRIKEARAYKIWLEALERMRPVLEEKGILIKDSWRCMPSSAWQGQGTLFEGVAAE